MTLPVRWRRFVRTFGYSGVRAAGIVDALSGRGGSLAEADRELLENLARRVDNGHRLTPQEMNDAAAALARVLPRYRVRMLIDAETGSFAVPQLREIHLRETSGVRAVDRPSIERWISELDDASEAGQILRWLCGDDFRSQALSRIGRRPPPVLINSVPRPARMSTRGRQPLLREVMSVPGAERHLFDRLEPLFDANGERAAPHLLSIGSVSRSHFSILKGNVTELTAREMLLSLMRDGSAFGGALPEGVVLVNGARVRRPAGSATLFSDGLVGALVDGRWHWYGVVEIKAYDSGLGDAAEQVVRWRDVSTLGSPFTLEFRAADTSFIGRDGRLVAVAENLRFDFDPATRAPGRRIELPRGRVNQILVAPQGASRFELAPLRAEMPGVVHRVSHRYTHTELEYLTALLLQEAAGSGSRAEAIVDLLRRAGAGEPVALPPP